TQHQRGQLGIDDKPAQPQPIEHAFEGMREAHKAVEVQDVGAALDGVDGPEGVVQRVVVGPSVVERHEGAFELAQEFVAVLEIGLSQLFEFVHAPTPCLNASTAPSAGRSTQSTNDHRIMAAYNPIRLMAAMKPSEGRRNDRETFASAKLAAAAANAC